MEIKQNADVNHNTGLLLKGPLKLNCRSVATSSGLRESHFFLGIVRKIIYSTFDLFKTNA